MTRTNHTEAEALARLLLKANLPENRISFGNFFLPAKKGITSRIKYNETDLDLLRNKHGYTVQLRGGPLEVSVQFYLNINNHYRLFAYSRSASNETGMLFSINVTTMRESKEAIFLTQKIRFIDRHDGHSDLAKQYRRQKQMLLAHILRRLGVEVSENNDIILGIFDPKHATLLNTTPSRLLNDFLMIALLKGHFMSNKGFDLDILPTKSPDFSAFIQPNGVRTAEQLPRALKRREVSRHIPLALRFSVLQRDAGRCTKCGASPATGAILHVDHILPFSHGGLSTLDNLRTLCADCNIGRSNQYTEA